MTIKKIAAAAALALSAVFANTAMAKETDLSGTTKDGHKVSIHADIEGTVKGAGKEQSLESILQTVFAQVAAKMDLQPLLGNTGLAELAITGQAALEGKTISEDAYVKPMSLTVDGVTIPIVAPQP